LLQSSKIILGIDPGTLQMGFSVIKVTGKTLSLVVMDSAKFSAKKNMFERLELILTTMQELIKLHKPHEMAIEAPFYGKNIQSMLKLGRAQGIAIAVAMTHGLPVTEYAPKKIKQSVTGNGNADKEQVWKMLHQLLILPTTKSSFDASDALAVAVCHHFQDNPSRKATSGKSKGWEDFIKNNPDKVK
jgi:crossover junction endodeoxyribonuclease RuvC